MPYIMKNHLKYSGGSVGDNSVELTMAEYEALEASGDVIPNTTYYITDAGESIDAGSVTYDNSDTNLNAVNVQEAIDENVKNISELNKKTDKFYSSPSMLGITSYHIPDIVQAMPAQSRFYDEVVAGSTYTLDDANNQFPINNGLLEIIKPATHVGRTKVLYFAKINAEVYGLYYCLLDENSWVINGWAKIATTEDISSGVDTSILGSQSTLPFPTSTFAYNIKQNATDISSIETLLGAQSLLPLSTSSFAYNIQKNATDIDSVESLLGSQSTLPFPTSTFAYNIKQNAADISSIETLLGAQIGTDSGWKTATVGSDFSLYNSSESIQYRKIGKVVYIRGAVKPNADISMSTTINTLFTLPSGYRPSRMIQTIQPTSQDGGSHFLMSISSTGTVGFSRGKLGKDLWAGFTTSFLVD